MHRLLYMIIMEFLGFGFFFFLKPFLDVFRAGGGLGIENGLEGYSSRLSQIAGFCKDACHPCIFFPRWIQHWLSVSAFGPAVGFQEETIRFCWNKGI